MIVLLWQLNLYSNLEIECCKKETIEIPDIVAIDLRPFWCAGTTGYAASI